MGRAQSNIDDSSANAIHACNDIGYASAVLKKRNYEVFLKDYQTEKATLEEVRSDIVVFLPDIVVISTTTATILNDIEFIKWIKSFHSCEFIMKGAVFFDIPEDPIQRSHPVLCQNGFHNPG